MQNQKNMQMSVAEINQLAFSIITHCICSTHLGATLAKAFRNTYHAKNRLVSSWWASM